MNVSCPECRTVYRVDPAKVIGANVRARCSACGGVIAVSDHVRWGDDFPDARLAPVTPRARAPETSPRSSLGATAAPAVGTPGSTTPAAAPEAMAPAPSRVPPFAPPRRPVPSSPAFGAPSFPASSLRPPTPAFVPSTPAPAPSFGAPLAPTPVRPVASPHRSAGAQLGSAGALTPRHSAAPTPAAPLRPASPSHEMPRPPAMTPPSTAQVAPAAPRKPLNPFLSNDPNQKARRLARALVSDMVAYHPQKREDGARQGTLKQLFREEIKKSYEEYVDQVGRDFAEATSHFQDALNEILAGGKRLF